MAFRIYLLGSLQVEKDGAAVNLPARKSEALLAALAVRPGVPLGREWLAALLWPDVPESQARTSLRQAVGHLRKTLSNTLIVTGADRLHLDPAVAWVDTGELARAAARPALERLALAPLWRGNLLEGFPALEQPFADWLAEERTRLSEQVAARLEECLAALSAANQVDNALAVGRLLLEIEPTREAVHRALMQLHAERGDRAAALLQYDRCRQILQRRLGIAPSSDTDSLRRAVAEASPPPAISPAVPVAASVVTAGDGPAGASYDTRREVDRLDGRTALAVLPFTFDGGEDDVRLLAAGLTEDVITELARFRQLALIARSSVADVAARLPSTQAVARETGARLALSGSVRAAGTRARITAALTDATTGLEVWAERWDAPRDDPFGVSDRLTRNLVSALALRIDDSRLGTTRGRPRADLGAHECWLRGMECIRRGTPSSDEEARGFFEQALAHSPSFARAHAGVSLSHFNDWSCQAWQRWDERERLSYESARRAVELDDGDHVTHTILARIHVYRGEFAMGERHLERALALNANDADMLMQAGVVVAQLGDSARACALSDTALALHPKRPDWYFPAAAFTQLVARHPEAALRLGSHAPDALVDARAHLACACAHLDDPAGARDHLVQFLANFRQKIVPARPLEQGEEVRWLLRVTPFRRAEDRDYLLAGLAGAGLECLPPPS